MVSLGLDQMGPEQVDKESGKCVRLRLRRQGRSTTYLLPQLPYNIQKQRTAEDRQVIIMQTQRFQTGHRTMHRDISSIFAESCSMSIMVIQKEEKMKR